MIMSEERALQLGLKPKAYIRSWTYSGVDPFDGKWRYMQTQIGVMINNFLQFASSELLLGPTFATAKVLQSMNLTLADIGVVEFHEAFAGACVELPCLVY